MENKIYNEFLKILDANQILLNEPMKNHTSFKVGGPVDIMVLPKNADEIKNILKLIKTVRIPFYIMGNGSNLLVRDKAVSYTHLDVYKRQDVSNITVKEISSDLNLEIIFEGDNPILDITKDVYKRQ